MSAKRFAALLDYVCEQSALENEPARLEDRNPVFDVFFDSEGRVLDGRARLAACLELGVPFTRRVQADEPVAFILSTLAGTPYTKAQLALTAARLLDDLQGERERKNFTGRIADVAGSLVGGVSVPYVTEARELLGKPEFSDVIALVDEYFVGRFTQVRQLVRMDDEARAKAIKRIRDGVDPAVVLKDAAVNQGDEWYTPADVAAAVTWAFGGKVGCDPCAPAGGGSFIIAETTYTEEQDGCGDEVTRADKPWRDPIWLNPPYSETNRWIERALVEQRNGKRLYVLLPVRPSSASQFALINAAFDILLLNKRLSFVLPKLPEDSEEERKEKSVGLSALMIVGLNWSTRHLLDMGIEGQIVKAQDRQNWFVEQHPVTNKRTIALRPRTFEPEPPLDFDRSHLERDRTQEEAEAQTRADADMAAYAELVRKGRKAVLEARKTMDEAAAKKRAARKAAKSKKS